VAWKPWDSLSQASRDRYQRHGHGKREHENRESPKVARGHKATPEHPKEATKKDASFPGYKPRENRWSDKTRAAIGESRGPLETEFVRSVARQASTETGVFYKGKSGWTSGSQLLVERSAKQATVQQLMTGINASPQKLKDLAAEQTPTDETGPFYKIQKSDSEWVWINPFWYHGGS
jgi:hypothetical protein